MLVEPSEKRRAEFVAAVKDSKFEVISELEDAESSIQLYGEVHPDVVVMAITFAGLGGIKMMQKLKEFYKDAKVVVTYDTRDRHLVMDAIRAGALANLRKPFRADRVVKALGQVMSASDDGAALQWSARLQARLIVRYKKSDAGFFTGYTETGTTNISTSGLGITATEPIPKNAVLKLQISLPTGTVKTNARVKRVEKKGPKLFELGLMYMDMSESKAKQIEAFIMSALSKQGGGPPPEEDE
jgi:two-component system chemotaxis response regulator CheY